PHKKQVFRIRDDQGKCIGADAIGLVNETHIDRMYHPFETTKSMALKGFIQEPLLETVMENGRISIEKRSLKKIAEYSKQRLSELPTEYKRFDNPHIYKIGISEALRNERDDLIRKSKMSLK